MTPPSASPFLMPLYDNARIDAYQHPCAKKFSTEEVRFNKGDNLKSFKHFTRFDQFKLDTSSIDTNTPKDGSSGSGEHTKYKSIGDFLSQSLYDHSDPLP